MTLAKRLRWFDEGARTLRAYAEAHGLAHTLPDGACYLCPCCLQPFPPDAVETGTLTAEDVPPVSVGGRKILLTCKPCNNGSGTEFDAHAATRARLERFAQRQPTGETVPVTINAGGIPLRGTAQWSGETLQLFGVPGQNDKRVQDAHAEALERYTETNDPSPDISFTFHLRYSDTRAQISWLRAGYLAAFAALGWSYILRAVMRPIREQLAYPAREILPRLVFACPGVLHDTRKILLVEESCNLRCVCVAMGDVLVLLPGLEEPMNCAEIADAVASIRAEGNAGLSLSGKELPWPSKATYLFD